MKSKLTWILTPLLALMMSFSFAQEKTITGTVTDESGLPLPGVSVLVVGTTKGTQTDFDGNYTINASEGQRLKFSYLGQKTVEKTIGASGVVSIAMEEDSESLEEVVVTGYATTSQKKLATATTTINSESISNRPNGNIAQTLSGQIPGLDIGTFSGQPGANATIQLRGINSINGNTEPLFIMDGVPVDEDNFRSLNPNEIESISVLKDAGATAIYGSRGANGVIVIKTKQGAKGSALKINYTGILSFTSLQNPDGYDLLDGPSYQRLEREYGNGRGAGTGTPLYPGIGRPLTDAEIATAPTTNWRDVFFRTGLTKNNTLTLSSGSETATQFTSIGYFEEDGILKGSNLQRFNVRNNITGSSKNGKFNYGTSVSLNYSKNNIPTSIGTTGVNQNPLFGAYSSLPYYLEEDYPGGRVLAQSFLLEYAPFYTIDKLATTTSLNEELKIIGSVNFSLKLTDNLTANLVSGIDYQSIVDLDAQDPISRNQLRFDPEVDGFQSQDLERQIALNTTSSLNWDKSFGKHTLGVGAYLEYFKAHFRAFGFTENGLNPKTFSPGDGSGFQADNADNDFLVDTVFADKLDAGLLSYFGNFNYDFDSKYGLSLTVRRDASYRFSTTNRWATFYSVSGRWNISEEAFMENSGFSSLKLRGSYGTSGNQRITGDSYFSGADLSSTFFATGQGYGLEQSIFLSQVGNNTLKWETVGQGNIGLDFGFLRNRLSGSIDVYKKKTTDLFQNRPISGINGQFNINANTGSLFNKGVDLELRYTAIDKNDFKLAFNVVGNYNENKLADLPSEDDQIIGIGRNGGRINEYFAVRYAGVNPANGNQLFYTADGDLTENPNVDTDRVWLDKSNNPDYQGSFGFSADYKGFFLTSQFNYEIGIDRFDNDLARFTDRDNIGQFNQSADLFRSWTPDNRITDYPSLNATNLNVSGTRFLKSADYVRLRFVTLGYNFPSEYLKNTGLSKIRIFGNAENLFTLTKWRGFDAAQRISGLEYPAPKIISFGLELGF
ncbi:SusC/RagA family TonB-linked outer membrane protein [Cellulophaga baltica]|uniref:SusC/RagA family TonB-linked outer membrane protein n=1 Tax=Cellulophaga baltica TaxID=76594 RepID=UPI00040D997B|nr:TonB-dependent receptor [Cellulophaga baltica]